MQKDRNWLVFQDILLLVVILINQENYQNKTFNVLKQWIPASGTKLIYKWSKLCEDYQICKMLRQKAEVQSFKYLLNVCKTQE